MLKIEMGRKYKTTSGLDVRILTIDRLHKSYSVIAEVFLSYNICPDLLIYTPCGKINSNGRPSSFDLVEVSPYEDFKDGDAVIVSDYSNFAYSKHRYFQRVSSNGEIAICYDNGSTKWSSESTCNTTQWKYCRKPTAEELA